MAIPSLPSSFYGEVRVNDAFVPDGTLVRALIEGQVYAEGYTQTYQGTSVYTLDIPGDDVDTTALDGGRGGDTVQFEIGGVLAEQTGTWQSGTNVRLDLTATAAEPLSEPQPTPALLPTQTAIPLASPLPTLASAEESSPSSDESSESPATSSNSSSSSSVPPASEQNSEIKTLIVHSSPEPAPPSNIEGSSLKSVAPAVIWIVAIVLIIGAVLAVRAGRKNKSSNRTDYLSSQGGS
jgi:hypothetical protein